MGWAPLHRAVLGISAAKGEWNLRPSQLFNASATWTSLDEKFKVQLWGKNLTDEEYESDLVTLVFPIYIPANPRTFGVKFSYSY